MGTTVVLAATTDELVNWAPQVKLCRVIETTIPDATIFESIRDLQSNSKLFPDWLKCPDSPEYNFIAPQHRGWRNDLCSTLQHSSWCSFGCKWDVDLPYAVATIFQICHHHEIARRSSRDGPGSKMDVRFCIDTLIAYSCEIGSDGLSHYLTDRMLRLPNWSKVATTTVDGVIVIPIADFRPYVSNLGLQEAADALISDQETGDPALVHCVAIFKRMESGENQMKMAMTSAMHQKKVLGLHRQFVFGIFQNKMDFIQVTAGCWISDKIKIYKVGTYSARDPTSLVQFYLVLRGIRQLASRYEEELMNSAATLGNAVDVKSPVNEWAPIRMIVTEDVSDESNHSESSGGSELIIRPGLSQALASLGQWDVDDRINTFCRNIGYGSNDSNSWDSLDPSGYSLDLQ
ncbi:hypothetical protein RSOLAG22IIIB_08382 [Rhizoctonia solani]|uniref:Uncharacterized protein n=1 Tax=Rhizoctonia solani TaxID=456999 RepID=A0A0K6FST4_9AGAM|nr:hypothetical protein RSOLAG22IIIB_08382 [Rhizoctonia solani]